MREILELCVQMDELANRTYASMARTCTDGDVRLALGALAVDEGAHIGWWRDLIEAWDMGLLPDIFSDTVTVRGELSDILEAMEAAVPATDAPISGDEALNVAVNIEFFMLDPMFGELLDLAEPAVARERHDAYSRHIDRLVSAVETHYEGRTLAGFLARVLRRSWRENRTLATYAMRDQLTGLANRRAFAAHLRQWTAWSARYGRPMAVLLVDIDNFKRVNDEYGHEVADKVLLSVAKAIASVTRASDLTARYGGDEFSLLAPETGPDEARMLADRIMDAVREVRVGVREGVTVSPTVSIGTGVTVDRPDSEPRPTAEILAAADQALYAAKQAGRDRASDPSVLASVA